MWRIVNDLPVTLLTQCSYFEKIKILNLVPIKMLYGPWLNEMGDKVSYTQIPNVWSKKLMKKTY